MSSPLRQAASQASSSSQGSGGSGSLRPSEQAAHASGAEAQGSSGARPSQRTTPVPLSSRGSQQAATQQPSQPATAATQASDTAAHTVGQTSRSGTQPSGSETRTSGSVTRGPQRHARTRTRGAFSATEMPRKENFEGKNQFPGLEAQIQAEKTCKRGKLTIGGPKHCELLLDEGKYAPGSSYVGYVELTEEQQRKSSHISEMECLRASVLQNAREG
jgi:hypothetical protein